MPGICGFVGGKKRGHSPGIHVSLDSFQSVIKGFGRESGRRWPLFAGRGQWWVGEKLSIVIWIWCSHAPCGCPPGGDGIIGVRLGEEEFLGGVLKSSLTPRV